LGSYLRSLGGQIVTGTPVKSLRELPSSRATLLDMTPRQILKLASDQFPPSYRWELSKYQYGAGVFKVDWALNAVIPWKATGCREAGTVHLGGTFDEVAAAELAVAKGRCAP